MYLRFFGLKEHPFHVTPDPRFIFWTDQHRDALDHLLYGIEQRKGFIELTGEVGTGKTTLCRECLSRLGDSVDTALILNPFLSEAHLLKALVRDLGLKPAGDDPLTLIEELNEFLLSRNHAGRNVVVFIDEAQTVPLQTMEQVRLLSNLETDRSKLLQIVLCGQPELRLRLSRPELRQLRQRISVRYTLGPLHERDMARYIAHRLAVAADGENVLARFTDSALWMIYAHSKGYPRLVNAVTDHALLAGYAEQRTVINDHCVRRGIQELEGEEQ